MKSILHCFTLLFWIFGQISAQNLISMNYQENSKEIFANKKNVLYFNAQTPFLQVSAYGLNEMKLRLGSENGYEVNYYEKNKSSQNIDFLYEGLIPGETYYIIIEPSFFEKNTANISLIAMNQRLNMNRTAKNVKPFQNVRVIENKQNAKISKQ